MGGGQATSRKGSRKRPRAATATAAAAAEGRAARPAEARPARAAEAGSAPEPGRRPSSKQSASAGPVQQQQPPAFASGEPGDHAETPLSAFQHVAPALRRLAAARGLPSSELRIWDPYYCRGTMLEHMRALGFSRVRNVPEDFYARIAAPQPLEPFHVLMTNPPFSGDNVNRCGLSGGDGLACLF